MLRKRGLTILFVGRAGCCCKFSLETDGRGRREGLGRPDGLCLLTVRLSMAVIVLEGAVLCSIINYTQLELCEFA